MSERASERTYRMTSAEGLNVEEGEGLVTLKELEARDLTWPFESAFLLAMPFIGRRPLCLGVA
jgi:hypothetical protein